MDPARGGLIDIPGPRVPEAPEHHGPGMAVALRSIRAFPDRPPAVSFAVAGTVLQDDDELSVVTTVPGSGRASRAGRRTGPRGRNAVTSGWDGTYDVLEWEGANVVRVHPRGRPWSLWRWHDGTTWGSDWYANLESPWRRTAVGFDTQDWALDVVATGIPGTADCAVRFKDEDEDEWYVREGVFTPDQATEFRRVGEEVAGLLRRGEGVAGADWSRWLPPQDAAAVPLPEGWPHLGGTGCAGVRPRYAPGPADVQMPLRT